MPSTGNIRSGFPQPLGTHFDNGGVNFALFSRHAKRVRLELYARVDDDQPTRVIDLEHPRHRTGDVWHVWVRDVHVGQLYAYRVDGPYRPEEGHRFNKHKLLLDPYARAIASPKPWDFQQALGFDPGAAEGDLAFSERDDASGMAKGVVVKRDHDAELVPFPRRHWSETIVYETHVRGLTIHPGSAARHPGTYRGVIEKLAYLKDLGVTAIELMPVFEFNEEELRTTNPETGERLKNYWGYSPVACFAPKASYGGSEIPGAQIVEFREMVDACHESGIEVILDVVFNHSAELDELGPTLSFRGLDNVIYYLLGENPRRYLNYSGTGNTLNANHPVMRDFILEALRYWVSEMRVDGFRFDLASVLARSKRGELLADPPLLEHIAEDPVLRTTKLIAEAWDAAGAYQVGHFSETRWAEWNGHYRDDVRRFWRGDDGLLGSFASRLCGSSDLYRPSGKGPECSINFVTCHDGFTLNDLVSYAGKHNAANGEDNRDGENENFSANYGAEGETDDPEIESVRVRQIKNFILTLMVSRGVPMLLGGDEFRRTQGGNNNAYCQDNTTSWYDWTCLERHREIHRFTRGMIAFRRAHPVLSRNAYYADEEIRFFAPHGGLPDWTDAHGKSLGVLIPGGDADLCLLFNAASEDVEFVLPRPPGGGRWHLSADTYQEPPGDLYEAGTALPLDRPENHRCGARSSAILLASSADGPSTDPSP